MGGTDQIDLDSRIGQVAFRRSLWEFGLVRDYDSLASHLLVGTFLLFFRSSEAIVSIGPTFLVVHSSLSLAWLRGLDCITFVSRSFWRYGMVSAWRQE